MKASPARRAKPGRAKARAAAAAPAAIPVVQPSLPPMAEFAKVLEETWSNRILTNGGPLHQRLEAALAEHLDVPHVSLFNNGTVALMAAVKALDLKGEVVTTPFSFVATAHSIVWGGATPVFADIEARTFGLDPDAVAAAVTPRTTGIMPVHCYGFPADVKGIAEVAEDKGLKVVYDAAHAFGVKLGARSVLRHGDLAVLSFHATKVFSTVEGGAIVSHDSAMKQRIDRLRNFGFHGEGHVLEVGLNGKLSEVHSAFGLAQLPHLAKALAGRRAVDRRYRRALGRVRGLSIPSPPRGGRHNHSYFPILVGEGFGTDRDGLVERLKANGVLSRRYFHPVLPDLEAYAGTHASVPVARRIASQVLCLPMYPHLSPTDQDRVIGTVLEARR